MGVMSFQLLIATVPDNPFTHQYQEAKQRRTSCTCAHALPGYTYIFFTKNHEFFTWIHRL